MGFEHRQYVLGTQASNHQASLPQDVLCVDVVPPGEKCSSGQEVFGEPLQIYRTLPPTWQLDLQAAFTHPKVIPMILLEEAGLRVWREGEPNLKHNT